MNKGRRSSKELHIVRTGVWGQRAEHRRVRSVCPRCGVRRVVYAVVARVIERDGCYECYMHGKEVQASSRSPRR